MEIVAGLMKSRLNSLCLGMFALSGHSCSFRILRPEHHHAISLFSDGLNLVCCFSQELAEVRYDGSSHRKQGKLRELVSAHYFERLVICFNKKDEYSLSFYHIQQNQRDGMNCRGGCTKIQLLFLNFSLCVKCLM